MDACNAKLRITDSACKCCRFFCMTHRHAETHGCTFNFKASASRELEVRLLAVKGVKLEKI